MNKAEYVGSALICCHSHLEYNLSFTLLGHQRRYTKRLIIDNGIYQRATRIELPSLGVYRLASHQAIPVGH